jgi:hypothetical protein
VNRRTFLLSGSAAAMGPIVAAAGVSCAQMLYPGLGPRLTCTAGILSAVAAMSADYQHATEWCWAASISMVFHYYNHPVSQARIVQQTWGQIINQPGSNGQILSDLSREWTDDDGSKFKSSCDAMSANPVTAAQDLGNDDPLIICSLGHAMVLTALTYVQNPSAPGGASVTAATVRDPWPGNGGRRVLSAQEWFKVSLLVRVRVEDT